MCNKYNQYSTVFYSQNLDLTVMLLQRRIPKEQVYEITISTCLDQRCSRREKKTDVCNPKQILGFWDSFIVID